ncbi:MAG: hypothetical protein KAJ19_00535 [Gammaproteobacteria bacterium]|nr:hypothetical protein [Gammaproteobacteria bacterium]
MSENEVIEFEDLLDERMENGRKEHGDWNISIPWEWAVWNMIEEGADFCNYFYFATESAKHNTVNSLIIEKVLEAFKPCYIFTISAACQGALWLLNNYGDSKIVKQLKEGSFKIDQK